MYLPFELRFEAQVLTEIIGHDHPARLLSIRRIPSAASDDAIWVQECAPYC